MTLHELLEAAQLDALGLLDAEEQQAFEKAFAAAAPAVREQVRREQARLCRMESVLPDVAPPADLRQRVLNAVSTAQAAEALSELQSGRVVHMGGRDGASAMPERRVSRLWRAAAVGFAAATVVFGVTTLSVQDQYKTLTRQLEDQKLLNDYVVAFGSELVSGAIFDANTKRVFPTSADAGFSGRAALWYNQDWQSADFFAMNLPSAKGTTYKLVARGRDGRVTREIAEFDSGAGVISRKIVVDPKKDYALALVSVRKGRPIEEGTTVLQSQPLATALAMVAIDRFDVLA